MGQLILHGGLRLLPRALKGAKASPKNEPLQYTRQLNNVLVPYSNFCGLRAS